ncbi:MAG: tRNA (adenosine(37)-N6)-dimethylallyltransferase MiaA [Acidobacteria bacterium]|nr:tRNA (adenosine(37)-N6)-dimethylallyltransferase MiaA [Acidobacteriota bacterium]
MVEVVVNEPLLIVIAGPTGSGKTALSIELAEHLGGEIVSCDSVAVYREMEIGTAKPSHEERARVPHYLIDVVDPSVEYTAGQYARDARAAIAEIAARGRVPIMAGGTGLYLRAVLEGLSPVARRDETIRARLRRSVERFGSAHLYRILQRLDAPAAASIHTNDIPKLIRAIEVCLLEKKPMSEAWQHQKPEPLTGFRIARIGLNPPRAALYDRLNARAAQMFADGLVEETRTLIAKYDRDCRALTSLGYAQAMAEIEGTMPREEALAAVAQGHRNYAKRQLTWFRRDAAMQWIEAFGSQSTQTALTLVKVCG